MLTTIKKLTIVAEGVLRDVLIRDIFAGGAHGYTIKDVHGHGSRGISDNVWFGPHIELQVLLSEEKALALMDILCKTYFDNYAIIAYLEDVQVLRGDKFM